MYNLHKNILKVVKVVKEKQTGRCNQVGKGALFPGPSLQLSGQVGGELPQPCTHTQPQRLQGGGGFQRSHTSACQHHGKHTGRGHPWAAGTLRGGLSRHSGGRSISTSQKRQFLVPCSCDLSPGQDSSWVFSFPSPTARPPASACTSAATGPRTPGLPGALEGRLL